MHRLPLFHKVEGSGPGLVLLHPIALDLTCWDAVAARLKQNFSVWRVDLRGHGRSSSAPDGYRLEDYAEDVHDVLIDVAPVAIVGLSFGGMLAQLLALNHPEDVSALVVCGCGSTLSSEARAAMAERGMAAIRGGMQAVIQPTLERWFTPEYLSSGRAEPIRRHLLGVSADDWHRGWSAIAALETAPRLHLIEAPTLCVAGAEDRAAQPSTLAAMAKAIPGGRCVVLEHAPHMMQIEHPEQFAGVVEDFLLGVHAGGDSIPSTTRT